MVVLEIFDGCIGDIFVGVLRIFHWCPGDIWLLSLRYLVGILEIF